MTCLSSAAEISPLPSLSNTLKALIIYYIKYLYIYIYIKVFTSINSSSESYSFIFLAISERNSGKSIVPLPSASTSLIISYNSASVGFYPNDLITVPSSLVVIVPSPSLSNKEKASLNSAIYSSVN
jgi:hypothetical protein